MRQVLPFVRLVNPGRKNLLSALLQCNVPVPWFGLPAVRAVIDIKWTVRALLLVLCTVCRPQC